MKCCVSYVQILIKIRIEYDICDLYREGHTGPGERGRAVRSAPVVRFAPTPPNSDRSNQRPYSHLQQSTSDGYYGARGGSSVGSEECELERLRGRMARERLQTRLQQQQQRASLDVLTPATVAIGSDPRVGLGGALGAGGGRGSRAQIAQPSMMPISPMVVRTSAPPSTPTFDDTEYPILIVPFKKV